MSQIKAVIFDIDGALLDNNEVHYKPGRNIWRIAGWNTPEELKEDDLAIKDYTEINFKRLMSLQDEAVASI